MCLETTLARDADEAEFRMHATVSSRIPCVSPDAILHFERIMRTGRWTLPRASPMSVDAGTPSRERNMAVPIVMFELHCTVECR